MAAPSRNSCGKVSFRSKAEAKTMRRKIAHAGGRKLYRCPDCGMWHMTSMTLTEQEAKGHRKP
jgi:uncharacterized C2H2 Zn-finger protein